MRTWIIHHSAPLAAGSAFTSLALIGVLADRDAQPPLGPGPFAVIATLMLAALACMIVYARWHLGLCERCFTGMSLNPSQDADRHKRALHATHLLFDHPRWVLYIGAMAVTGASLMCLIWQPLIGGPLTGGLFAWTLLTVDLHVRLQPWCPWCRRGRGGRDGTPAPVEPLSPAHSR